MNNSYKKVQDKNVTKKISLKKFKFVKSYKLKKKMILSFTEQKNQLKLKERFFLYTDSVIFGNSL